MQRSNLLPKDSKSFLLHFLPNLFHAIWLFFPGIIFLVLTLMCFWNLSQGKDLMLMATQQPGFYSKFILLLVFLVLTAWYGSRIISELKCRQNEKYLSPAFRRHVPRLLGFLFFIVITLSFLQTPVFKQIKISDWESRPYYILLALLLLLYFPVVRFFERWTKDRNLKWFFFAPLSLAVIITIICSLNMRGNGWLAVINFFVLAFWFLLFVVTRREYQIQMKQGFPRMAKLGKQESEISVKRKPPFFKWLAEKLHLHESESSFLSFFGLAFLAALGIYILCTFSLETSVWMGAFSLVLLAFAVFMAFGYFISILSIKAGVNLHVIPIVLAFIFGFWTERHYVNLVEKTPAEPVFKSRMALKEYFDTWVTERKDLINKSTEYPVYFILSDGGASRSGYWVASVLSKLQDTTQGQFANHLFCLSGASGGSVGNATFYMLLKRYHTKIDSVSDGISYLPKSVKYLKSDFLAYTLSRMLGHDLFVQMFPFDTKGDRADALAQSLQWASDDTTVHLETKLSELVTKTKSTALLPILCVNSTRMQDGKPSVISTIQIDNTNFNSRLDVLDLLQPSQDMRLSTAVVLGASFPYICPAGRIDEIVPKRKDSVREHYFVDGGYVDNSGAGVVHEMLIQLRKWKRDSINNPVYQKLHYIVIHISNGPSGESLLSRVNPLTNDLAAPLKTLAGSYSIQTSINDKRLENYVKYSTNPERFWTVNLYREPETMVYSMNWVISNRLLDSMDRRVYDNVDLKNLINSMYNYGIR